MKQIDVAIAIVRRDDLLLICRRRPRGHLAGFWEFPGGKVEPGESPNQCAERELREEVDLIAKVETELPIIQHAYSDRKVRIHPFLCSYVSGTAKPIECDEAIWVRVEQLKEYRFPDANDGLIEDLIELLGRQ